MRRRTLTMTAVVVLALCVSCGVEARHRTRTKLFDGVPPLEAKKPAGSPSLAPADRDSAPAVALHEHGPYAAKLCGACHDASAANATVVPEEQLCRQCHEPESGWKYEHGPHASGACLTCHDPHRSREPGLLVASGDAVCLRCHERGSFSPTEAHADPGPGCTTCHGAHGSDSKYLLR